MELRCVAARSCPLLSILRRELGMSSSLVGRLKYQHIFFVNGAPQFTNYRVSPGDEIRVPLGEPEPEYPAEPGELAVLFEDESLLALDKPAGLMMHPSSCRMTGTLANRVIAYYRATGQESAFHPVSRLDRDTFGVVLLAKNSHVHARCCAMLLAGGFRKTYRACVLGGPADESGVIDLPIARLPGRTIRREVRADGQEARTEYRVLARADGLSLLALRPLTGRTHQLRVHCAAMGFPVLGDPQYGGPESVSRAAALGLTGQQLCAVSLAFSHPMTGAAMEIRSKQAVFWPEAQDFSI